MKRWGVWLIGILLVVGAVVPVAAQTTPPIAFADPMPMTTVWPNVVEAKILNNTTQTLNVTAQLTHLEETQSGAVLSAGEFWQPIPPSIAIPPAGEAALFLAMNNETRPAPGEYTGSLVLSVPAQNAVLRKPITVVIAPVVAVLPEAPVLSPAVESWTLNAVRIFPFTKPLCLRGLSFKCTLPLADTGASSDPTVVAGHLTNERGGALTVILSDTDPSHGAELDLAFDRPWGYTGTYIGSIDLAGASVVPGTDDEHPGTVALTVHVKDIILWPLGALWLGISLARQAQRFLTVRRLTLDLLRRLNDAGLKFAKMRKSVHGYSVAEDFQAGRAALEGRIETWDREHYGPPTEAERQELESTILIPLAELEKNVDTWGQFRTKLDRLGRKLLQEAYPAIQEAQRPAGIDLDEPRFYTAGRQLLRGTKLQIAQVWERAHRIDDLAELAGAWGELQRLAVLVRDAIGELNAPDVNLSDSENEMLEAARHHLNSAARDLWEAPSLENLRARETENELKAAQELTRRLMDPFVYYAGSELTTQLGIDEADFDLALEAGEGAEGFPIRILGRLKPMMRTYARIDTFRLPRLDFDVYQALKTDQERAVYAMRVLIFGERTIMALALLTSLLVGLERYFTTDFGSTADYLSLFTSGLVTKAGLELINMVLSRLLPDNG
jgi:hypothetical protein